MSTYASELFTPQAEHADEFAEVALRAIDGLPNGSRVLDVGCGSGDLIRRALRPGLSFTGIDISRPNIEAARRAAPSATFHCADFLRAELGRFDLVFANSVLHLIECPDDRMAEALASSLAPDGMLIAAIPVDSTKNRALSLQRKAWSLLPGLVDKIVAAILRDANAAERIVYFRIPPARLLNESFCRTLAGEGIRFDGQRKMRSTHFLKLDHAIATFSSDQRRRR